MKWWKGSLWILMGLVLLLVVAASVYTTRAMPVVDGELRVAGLRQSVRVERDPHGIPTIKAQNLHDLMFALGFVHAQDRLWQLETHRRIGSGRLAEAFGEGALESDKFLRALGVRRAAAAQWARASTETPASSAAATMPATRSRCFGLISAPRSRSASCGPATSLPKRSARPAATSS